MYPLLAPNNPESNPFPRLAPSPLRAVPLRSLLTWRAGEKSCERCPFGRGCRERLVVVVVAVALVAAAAAAVVVGDQS